MDTQQFRWFRALAAALMLALASWAWPGSAQAARIKEVAAVQGVRTNQLVGYGLVVGLDGTGDQTTQTPFTAQSLTAMLQQLGVTVPAGTNMQLRNVAAVMVTATLPPFAQPGQAIDVTAASLGNAKSLRGGTLIATPLRGADGQIYALAQGNLVIAGAGASAGGTKVQVNHLSAGRIPGGATVERAVASPLAQGDSLQLDIASADFTTARAVAKAINERFGKGTAQALDGRVVKVKMPPTTDERVSFLADMENLPIELATPAARVVINARTGSIVVNQAVTLGPCAVAHGNLSVTISSTPVVSQPAPLSGGQTVQTEKVDITMKQDPGSLIQLPAGAKLTDVVKALNSLGATPADLLAILQAIKAAGALQAELEVI
ncbi:MAG TPA: flagellar basal body P-ring protein FlgI [Burkholderiaceae bacterium]|nr:flagellar basal body P-ring protein FlgI [Burkholderiaceae bacterium]HMX09710.1 flagellar basal body P-ring protein FlgI [Burkholderiaceae bacterium]HMY99757.1 flagellar basal body P-ring protein FlgI [Burkholderiaceae bacterium]HNB45945.1 flagellar basal body P-ring protein FlgI [Burkholderiaceae bacterium]HNG78241.1 flagellar basal body P-ring protein FlgI [Burkholderiaceae bacterium]